MQNIEKLKRESSLIPFCYGSLAFPLSIMAITYYVLLPKWYSESYGVTLTNIGLWLTFSRVWDAVSDPLCGYLSDYFLQRGIKRKVFVRFGLLLLAGSFFFLLNPALSGLSPVLSFIAFSFLFYTGFTLVSVPYEALALDLKPRSVERTPLIAWRDGFLVLGTIGAALFPLLFGLADGLKEEKNPFLLLSLVYLAMLVFAYLLLELTLRSKHDTNESIIASPRISFQNYILLLKEDKPFLKLLFAFIVNSFGAALPAALFLFFAQYRLGVSEENAYASLLLYFSVGFLALPLWVKASARYQKKKVWFLSQIINAGAFLPVAFLGDGDYIIFLVLVSFSALGFGGVMVLPSILQADIIESTNNRTGRKVEATYVGIWSVARKLSQAFGSGLGIYLLGVSGFIPGISMTAFSMHVLSVLYALVPSVSSLISIWIAWDLHYSLKMEEND